MPFSQSIDHNILDHFFGKSTWAATGENRYIGLSSTTPTKTGGNVNEPSGGGYARVQLLAVDMDVAVTSVSDNLNEKTFPQATADWVGAVNLTDLVMYDASTAGTFIAFKALTQAKPVLNGDTAKIPVGDLTATIAGAL